MRELDKVACIDGMPLQFEAMVKHASDDKSIVLCRDTSGELRFVTPEEWRAASVAADKSDGLGANINAYLDAPVTRRSPFEDKVALLMSIFRGRSDVYGKGFVAEDTKEGKLGYYPPCKLRWVHGVCPRLANSKARCSDCDHPSFMPLTSNIVSDHCRGKRDSKGRIQAIGIYVVVGDVCYLLAADFDGPGWQEAAAAYRDVCRSYGLSPAVERSRSGNGAHVWVFFDGPVKASFARRVGEGFVSQARNACTAVSFRSYDRLFPLQDSVSGGHLGSLIALPLQGEAMRRGNSVFVDDQFNTIRDQCAYLSTLPKASAERISELAEQFGEDPIGLPKASNTMLFVTQAQATISEMPSNETSTKEMPASVQVTLSNGVRIDCSELPAQIVNRLSRLAAFRNPEYGKKLRMHFSVRNIPRFIDQSRFENDELVLPRACFDEALSVIRAAGAKPHVVDARSAGRQIHARFTGVLRASQEPCREKLVAHELGVLVAPMGFGKTVIAASIIATHQVSTLIIVPKTPLLDQWRKSLSKYLSIDDEPPVLLTPTGRKRKQQPGVIGVIGGGKQLRSGIVDIALASSLYEKGEVAGDKVVSSFVGEYGMVIVDEAHKLASPTVLEVLGAVRAHYVYAMTATPTLTDGLDRILFLECGPLRHEASNKEQMAEQGMRRLLVTRFSMSRPNLEERTSWNALVDYICVDEERNHLVATDAVRALRHGRTPLVLTRRVEHARVLAKLIEEGASSLGAQVFVLVGADSNIVRRKNLEDLRLVPSQQPLCVVATGSYVGEGFDLDRLDTLLFAGPVADERPLTQWTGRLHRARLGKQEVIVMDYIDPAIPMFDREWRKRLRQYRKLGYQTATEDDLSLVGLESNSSPLGHLFSGKQYMQGLENDLVDCSSHVLISSSWSRYDRLKTLRPTLEGMLGRGVKVEVLLSKPSKASSEWQQIRATLQDLGCNVRAVSAGGFPNCVVLDDAVLWYGAIAPLAFPKKDDCSLRMVSREVARSLVEALGEKGPC